MAGTTPSNYMEVRNKDNVFLFSDTTRLMHIVDKGEVSAVSYEGEVYGFELEDNVEFISYSIRNGVLYVSPVTNWNGKRYQYVTADTDGPIKYFKWSRDYFKPMEHGAGLELRDASGNIVFNNQGFLGSFKKSFYSTVTTKQNLLAIADVPNANGWYTTDGFPALYMAVCALMWGVYRVHHEEEGKGGFLGLFHDSWDVTDGYIFAPLGKLTPGPQYDTVIEPELEKLCTSGMEEWFDPLSDSRVRTGVLNVWEHIIEPSDSIMAPQTIWLPALSTLEAIKNSVYTYGYRFTNVFDGVKVNLEKEITRLCFRELKGYGSLENLNKVVYTDAKTTRVYISNETGDISNSSYVKSEWFDSNGKQVFNVKEYGKIYRYKDTGELVPYSIDVVDGEFRLITKANVDEKEEVLGEQISEGKTRMFVKKTYWIENREVEPSFREFFNPNSDKNIGLFAYSGGQLVSYHARSEENGKYEYDTEIIEKKIRANIPGKMVDTPYVLTEGLSCDFSIAHIVSTI